MSNYHDIGPVLQRDRPNILVYQRSANLLGSGPLFPQLDVHGPTVLVKRTTVGIFHREVYIYFIYNLYIYLPLFRATKGSKAMYTCK